MVREIAEKTFGIVQDLVMMLLSSLLMIILGLIYFLITLWIVKVSAGLLGIPADGGLLVLTAGILSAASVIASKKR